MLDEIELKKTVAALSVDAPKAAVRFDSAIAEIQRPFVDLLADSFATATGRPADSKFDLIAAAVHPNTIRVLQMRFKALVTGMRERVLEYNTAMRELDEADTEGYNPAKYAEQDPPVKGR